jgi:hypothetical protein
VTTTDSTAQSKQSAGRLALPTSVVAWLALVAYTVLAKLALGMLPAINVKIIASDLSWPNIVAFGVLGLIGASLCERTGFMPALDARVSNRQRFLVPLPAGAGLAVLAILIDIVTHGTKFIETQTGEASFNVYFPASLLVYTAGITNVEAFFRVFPLPLLQGLISNVILRNKWPERVYWVLAIVLSLIEPATQGLGIVFLKTSESLLNVLLTKFLPYFVTNYPLNLGQALFFRKRGLLASWAMRLGFYLLWHIVYGNFIYPLVRV